MDYAFLQKPLTDFIEQKLAEAEPEGTDQALNKALWIDPETSKTPFRQLYESMQLTEQEFAKAYLDPWKDLSLAQMQDVLTYLNFFIGRKNAVVFTVNRQQHFKALHWLLVHIDLLNLPSLSVLKMPMVIEQFGDEVELIPHQQCFICGKLGLVKGQKYCHLPGCDTADPNGSGHEASCCYRIWRNRRESVKKSLREVGSEQEANKRFLKFCEKQFVSNQALQYDVRPMNMGPHLKVMSNKRL